jgi:hypothetical protein
MAMLAVGGANDAFSRLADIRSELRELTRFDLFGPPHWVAIPQSVTEVTDSSPMPMDRWSMRDTAGALLVLTVGVTTRPIAEYCLDNVAA